MAKKQDKVIVTCAITGAMHLPCMSPYLPITPQQIEDEAVAAAEAGASIIHLHARDPETGFPTTDPKIYARFLSGIKSRSDAIINITTGQPSLAQTPDAVMDDRLRAPLEFAPEICSYNMGPMNPGIWALQQRLAGKTTQDWEEMFMRLSKGVTIANTYASMERLAKELGEDRGVRFEFECFDIGHLHTLHFIAQQGWVKPPFFIQSIFGFLGGLGADPAHIIHAKQTADALFGDDYHWSVLVAGKDQMRLGTLGATLGGNVRVGLEDSLWDSPRQLAKSNADQVRRIVRILNDLSLDVATPDEARAMLGTKGKDKVNF